MFLIKRFLWDALGVPPTQVSFDASAWVLYILPPILWSFMMTILALMNATRIVGLSLWPVMALLALRAVASLNLSLDKPEWRIMDAFFVVAMFSTTARALDWTLAKPLVRHSRPANSSPSILMDAFDLTTNLRGIGWNWSHKLYIPPDTRPKDRLAFALCTFLSAVVHTLVWHVSEQAILSFIVAGPVVQGPTIFDETLPFFIRNLRAGIVTALYGILAYACLQTCYDIGTIIGVVFMQQDPAQWPPAFDAPWRATSLSSFWGRRWHQWHRRNFLFLGGYPLGILLGRTGVVLGSFLASAVIHDILLAALDNKSEAWRMFAAFGMMAPGVLAERAFYRLTRKKVGGVVGWVWTMTWLLIWSSLMVDAMVRTGIMRSCSSPYDTVPLRALVERVVTRFDAWLRTI